MSEVPCKVFGDKGLVFKGIRRSDNGGQVGLNPCQSVEFAGLVTHKLWGGRDEILHHIRPSSYFGRGTLTFDERVVLHRVDKGTFLPQKGGRGGRIFRPSQVPTLQQFQFHISPTSRPDNSTISRFWSKFASTPIAWEGVRDLGCNGVVEGSEPPFSVQSRSHAASAGVPARLFLS